MAEPQTISNVSSDTLRLKIPNISHFEKFQSKIFTVNDIPWQVAVMGNFVDGKKVLGLYLYCEKEGKPVDWNYTAAASFKWLNFDHNRKAIEEHTEPFVFDEMENGFGRISSVKWEDLFGVEKGFVRDNECTLMVKIEVLKADPLNNKNSELRFQHLANAKYRLEVTNINNLMAVRSPTFMLQDLQWNLLVYKDHSSNIGVYLYRRGDPRDISFRMSMSAKLLSSNDSVGIEKICTNTIQEDTFYVEKLASWEEIFEPRNGFVMNNTIVIEVDIRMAEQMETTETNGSNGQGPIKCEFGFEI